MHIQLLRLWTNPRVVTAQLYITEEEATYFVF